MTTVTQKKSLDRIDHVAIAVSDIEEAVSWYTQNLDCEVLYRDETWALVELQNLRLAFVVRRQHPPHIAVIKEDAEKYGELKQHRDGTSSTYIEDPFGNSIEIMAGGPR